MIDPNFYTTQHIELEVAELDIDEGLKDVILTTLERYEALKAKIAEIEKQEPFVFGWQHKNGKTASEIFSSQEKATSAWAEFSNGGKAIALYASPIQQSPTVAVNEHIYMNAKLYSDDDVQVILKECSEALGVDNLTNLWQISGRIRDGVKQ